MRVRVLGEVRAGAAGEPVPVVNLRQRRILVALLLAGPPGLSVAELAGRVWDEGGGPASRVPTLRTYVQRLRATIEDGAGHLVTTRPGGYALAVADEDVDARAFALIVESARGELDPSRSEMLLDEALAAWGGPPFPGLEEPAWCAGEAARLEELHVEAQELRLSLRLDRGAGDVAADAELLLREHPYRERLRVLRALALYRAGRQADALADIAEHRRRLADELGVEVSTEVRDLELAILRQSPELDGPRRQGRRLRGYRLGSRIGMGAHSVVYRANQPSVGRDVAIKVVRRELANDRAYVRRFAIEAQTVARLSHPHIVPLHDYWREADQAYLVMRWVEGGSLEDTLRHGPLDVGRAATIVGQLASALDFAHRRGVVHRDVKPSNVLLDSDGNAFLGDFGIALVDGPDEEVPSLRAVGSPTFAAPEQFDDDAVGPPADVYALGVLLYVLVSGRAPWPGATDTLTLSRRHRSEPLPPLATGAPVLDGALDAVVARATAKSPEDRYPTAGALAADLAVAASSAPLPLTSDIVNPYLGLAAFGEPDAARFFGREALVARVVERLEPGAGVLLVGPSGCGKSSLVHAGVVPRLRGTADGPVVTSMVPGAGPVAALVQALQMVATEPAADLAALLARGVGAAEAARTACPGERVVLVVDQLEEVFTQCAAEEAEEFLAILAEGMETAGDDFRLLLTVRADFFDRPLDSRSFGSHVGDTVEPVRPLTADELVAAIVEPARAVGVVFTEPVLARLVADAAGGPGRLPLLQFALTRMFERRSGDRIDVSDYERVGGIAGALADAAEQRFAALSETDRDAVRRMMSRLVTVEDEVTRRREPRAEVEAVSGVSPALVDLLVGDRLLTLDRQPTSREPTVELVHEALLDAWPRLRGWVEQDRAVLAALSRLHADAAVWEAEGHDTELLYRGGRLASAEQLVTEATVGFSGVERDFVTEALRRREEEAARAAREQTAAQSRRRRRTLALAATSVLVVASLVAAVFGVASTRQASADRAAARFRDLVSTARTLQDTRTDVALLLAAEAYTQDPGPQAQGALLSALRRLDATVEVWGETRFRVGTAAGGCVNLPGPGVLVVQPQPNAIGAVEANPELLEVDLASRQVTRLEDQPLVCDVRRVPDPPADGATYLGELEDGTAAVVDASGATVATFPGWSGAFYLADGRIVARRGPAGESGPYHLLDEATGDPLGGPVFTGGQAWLSPGGSRIVVVGPIEERNFGATSVDLVDAETFEAVATLTDVVPASPPAWGPGDGLVALGDERGTLGLWRGGTGRRLLEAADVRAALVAISPDEETLAVSTGRGTVEYRDAGTGQVVDTVDPGQQVLMELEWIDGDRLAALGAGGVVSVLSRAEGGLGERGPRCCRAEEFSFVVPDGDPHPYAYYGHYETGGGRFVDLVTGEEVGTVDMGPYVFDPWASETRLSDGSAVLLKPSGEMLLVDRDGVLVADGPTPVHDLPERVPPMRPVPGPHGASRDDVLMQGVLEGEPGDIRVIETAVVHGRTLEVVAGPTPVELPEPAVSVTLHDGGVISAEYEDGDGFRYEFMDTSGVVLARAPSPVSVGWRALTGDHRYVVLADPTDDGVRVVDTVTEQVTVLPVNGEPQPPDMLSDSRFLLQTREGQYELWDAVGPTRIGAVADPGPFATTTPTVTPDERFVWIVLDGAWTRLPIDPQEWLTRACSLAGRALTEQEWRDFVPGDAPYRNACADAA